MKAHRAADAALVAPFRVNRHTRARMCEVEPGNPPQVPHVPHRGGIFRYVTARTRFTTDGLWTEFFPPKKEAGTDG